MSASAPTASVAVSIATHNRLNDLQRTLEALNSLDPKPLEVWICADGCTDGTGEFVRREYPHYQLIENAVSRGSVACRDQIIRACQSPLILSIDDDSYPVEKDFLLKVNEVFYRFPDLGVLTFPQRSDEFPDSLTCNNFGPSMWVGSFPNSGAVIRRETYMRTSGYPKFFFHAYEEPDFALQCHACGYRVLYYTELTIRHHFTWAGRNEMRTHQRHARNELWSVLMRCPWWLMPVLVPYRMLRQFMYAGQRGWSWVAQEPRWWWAAMCGTCTALKNRKSVSYRDYRRWLRLVGSPEPAKL